MKLKDKVIVITGGGSGIGRALVYDALNRGAKVAAVDLRAKSLDETAALAGAGERLSVHAADITDRAAVADLPAEILNRHGSVDGLINNAGVIQPFVPIADLGTEEIDRMIAVNLMGPINVTKAFLPELLRRPQAHIANVSSMGGFIPFPGQSMYGAAKAGVKLFSEGLYAELIDTNVGVSVVMPGAVATDIALNSGVDMGAATGSEAAASSALPADQAARIILDGIEANRLHIYVGRDSRMLNLMVRIAPAWAIRTIQKKMKAMIDKARS